MMSYLLFGSKQFCFIATNHNIVMKSNKPSNSPYDFTISTVSTSFLSNSTLSYKQQSPTHYSSNRMESMGMDGYDNNRFKKQQSPFRNSVKYDKPSTPPSTKNKLQTFLRNTSYYSIQQNPSFSSNSKVIKADLAPRTQKFISTNLKTCASIENSALSYQRILEKINKKQRLINQLKELSKISITESIRHPTQANQHSKINVMKKQQRGAGQHMRDYHSEPSKNKYQQNNHSSRKIKIDLTRSTATNQIKQSQPVHIGNIRQKSKTQIAQEYQSTSILTKTQQLKRYRELPNQTIGVQMSPLKLNFSKCQVSAENYKEKRQYTSRQNIEPPSYAAPLTSRNQSSNNIYDFRQISDIKRIKNNASYFTHKKAEISDFILLKALGQGKFGTVYQAIHKPTKGIFAIKKIPKKTIKHNLMIDQLVKQIKIQSVCRHQNIVQLYGFFDDKQFIYLVLQYMSSGTLFHELKKKKCLSEEEAVVKLRHAAKAIVYMHQKGIAHRDIKPQNMVIQSGVGKICDFGWATSCEGDRRKTYCGTFDYAAPEILQGTQYDYSVDLWCLGVLAYELLVGKAPFFHYSRKETMKKIMNVDHQIIKYPLHLSKKAVSFIESLIKKNPEERMSGGSILNHPFLQSKEQRN